MLLQSHTNGIIMHDFIYAGPSWAVQSFETPGGNDAQKVNIPRGIKLTADDIREGVIAICSCFIAEPQFQGQTKDKLNKSFITSN